MQADESFKKALPLSADESESFDESQSKQSESDQEELERELARSPDLRTETNPYSTSDETTVKTVTVRQAEGLKSEPKSDNIDSSSMDKLAGDFEIEVDESISSTNQETFDVSGRSAESDDGGPEPETATPIKQASHETDESMSDSDEPMSDSDDENQVVPADKVRSTSQVASYDEITEPTNELSVIREEPSVLDSSDTEPISGAYASTFNRHQSFDAVQEAEENDYVTIEKDFITNDVEDNVKYDVVSETELEKERQQNETFSVENVLEETRSTWETDSNQSSYQEIKSPETSDIKIEDKTTSKEEILIDMEEKPELQEENLDIFGAPKPLESELSFNPVDNFDEKSDSIERKSENSSLGEESDASDTTFEEENKPKGQIVMEIVDDFDDEKVPETESDKESKQMVHDRSFSTDSLSYVDISVHKSNRSDAVESTSEKHEHEPKESDYMNLNRDLTDVSTIHDEDEKSLQNEKGERFIEPAKPELEREQSNVTVSSILSDSTFDNQDKQISHNASENQGNDDKSDFGNDFKPEYQNLNVSDDDDQKLSENFEPEYQNLNVSDQASPDESNDDNDKRAIEVPVPQIENFMQDAEKSEDISGNDQSRSSSGSEDLVLKEAVVPVVEIPDVEQSPIIMQPVELDENQEDDSSSMDNSLYDSDRPVIPSSENLQEYLYPYNEPADANYRQEPIDAQNDEEKSNKSGTEFSDPEPLEQQNGDNFKPQVVDEDSEKDSSASDEYSKSEKSGAAYMIPVTGIEAAHTNAEVDRSISSVDSDDVKLKKAVVPIEEMSDLVKTPEQPEKNPIEFMEKVHDASRDQASSTSSDDIVEPKVDDDKTDAEDFDEDAQPIRSAEPSERHANVTESDAEKSVGVIEINRTRSSIESEELAHKEAIVPVEQANTSHQFPISDASKDFSEKEILIPIDRKDSQSSVDSKSSSNQQAAVPFQDKNHENQQLADVERSQLEESQSSSASDSDILKQAVMPVEQGNTSQELPASDASKDLSDKENLASKQRKFSRSSDDSNSSSDQQEAVPSRDENTQIRKSADLERSQLEESKSSSGSDGDVLRQAVVPAEEIANSSMEIIDNVEESHKQEDSSESSRSDAIKLVDIPKESVVPIYDSEKHIKPIQMESEEIEPEKEENVESELKLPESAETPNEKVDQFLVSEKTPTRSRESPVLLNVSKQKKSSISSAEKSSDLEPHMLQKADDSLMIEGDGLEIRSGSAMTLQRSLENQSIDVMNESASDFVPDREAVISSPIMRQEFELENAPEILPALEKEQREISNVQNESSTSQNEKSTTLSDDKLVEIIMTDVDKDIKLNGSKGTIEKFSEEVAEKSLEKSFQSSEKKSISYYTSTENLETVSDRSGLITISDVENISNENILAVQYENELKKQQELSDNKSNESISKSANESRESIAKSESDKKNSTATESENDESNQENELMLFTLKPPIEKKNEEKEPVNVNERQFITEDVILSDKSSIVEVDYKPGDNSNPEELMKELEISDAEKTPQSYLDKVFAAADFGEEQDSKEITFTESEKSEGKTSEQNEKVSESSTDEVKIKSADKSSTSAEDVSETSKDKMSDLVADEMPERDFGLRVDTEPKNEIFTDTKKADYSIEALSEPLEVPQAEELPLEVAKVQEIESKPTNIFEESRELSDENISNTKNEELELQQNMASESSESEKGSDEKSELQNISVPNLARSVDDEKQFPISKEKQSANNSEVNSQSNVTNEELMKHLGEDVSGDKTPTDQLEVSKQTDLSRDESVKNQVEVEQESDASKDDSTHLEVERHSDVSKDDSFREPAEVEKESAGNKNDSFKQHLEVEKHSDVSKDNSFREPVEVENESDVSTHLEIKKHSDVSKDDSFRQPAEVEKESDVSKSDSFKHHLEVEKLSDVSKDDSFRAPSEIEKKTDVSKNDSFKHHLEVEKHSDVSKDDSFRATLEVEKASDVSKNDSFHHHLEVEKPSDMSKDDSFRESVEVEKESDVIKNDSFKHHLEVERHSDMSKDDSFREPLEVEKESDVSKNDSFKHHLEVERHSDVSKDNSFRESVEVEKESDVIKNDSFKHHLEVEKHSDMSKDDSFREPVEVEKESDVSKNDSFKHHLEVERHSDVSKDDSFREPLEVENESDVSKNDSFQHHLEVEKHSDMSKDDSFREPVEVEKESDVSKNDSFKHHLEVERHSDVSKDDSFREPLEVENESDVSKNDSFKHHLEVEKHSDLSKDNSFREPLEVEKESDVSKNDSFKHHLKVERHSDVSKDDSFREPLEVEKESDVSKNDSFKHHLEVEKHSDLSKEDNFREPLEVENESDVSKNDSLKHHLEVEKRSDVSKDDNFREPMEVEKDSDVSKNDSFKHHLEVEKHPDVSKDDSFREPVEVEKESDVSKNDSTVMKEYLLMEPVEVQKESDLSKDHSANENMEVGTQPELRPEVPVTEISKNPLEPGHVKHLPAPNIEENSEDLIFDDQSEPNQKIPSEENLSIRSPNDSSLTSYEEISFTSEEELDQSQNKTDKESSDIIVPGVETGIELLVPEPDESIDVGTEILLEEKPVELELQNVPIIIDDFAESQKDSSSNDNDSSVGSDEERNVINLQMELEKAGLAPQKSSTDELSVASKDFKIDNEIIEEFKPTSVEEDDSDRSSALELSIAKVEIKPKDDENVSDNESLEQSVEHLMPGNTANVDLNKTPDNVLPAEKPESESEPSAEPSPKFARSIFNFTSPVKESDHTPKTSDDEFSPNKEFVSSPKLELSKDYESEDFETGAVNISFKKGNEIDLYSSASEFELSTDKVNTEACDLAVTPDAKAKPIVPEVQSILAKDEQRPTDDLNLQKAEPFKAESPRNVGYSEVDLKTNLVAEEMPREEIVTMPELELVEDEIEADLDSNVVESALDEILETSRTFDPHKLLDEEPEPERTTAFKNFDWQNFELPSPTFGDDDEFNFAKTTKADDKPKEPAENQKFTPADVDEMLNTPVSDLIRKFQQKEKENQAAEEKGKVPKTKPDEVSRKPQHSTTSLFVPESPSKPETQLPVRFQPKNSLVNFDAITDTPSNQEPGRPVSHVPYIADHVPQEFDDVSPVNDDVKDEDKEVNILPPEEKIQSHSPSDDESELDSFDESGLPERPDVYRIAEQVLREAENVARESRVNLNNMPVYEIEVSYYFLIYKHAIVELFKH